MKRLYAVTLDHSAWTRLNVAVGVTGRCDVFFFFEIKEMPMSDFLVSSKIKLAGLSVQRQNNQWEKNVAVVPKQRDGHYEAISQNCLSLFLYLSLADFHFPFCSL